MSETVHLGFEVGTGSPVVIPLAHTFVCGQSQQSGKTTALEAIATRSGRAALAFITKRGETFSGLRPGDRARRIRPYLPREGEQPVHWRLVETIMASALGQRHLKYERFQILNAAKGARSLADVRANLTRLAAPKKKQAQSRVQETYTLLGEYLDMVLPEMEALDAWHVWTLAPGLNVMDLSEASAPVQALVIRAALAHINVSEHHVLTLLPEAWQFAPRDTNSPAKDEAIHMARKGAAPDVQNFLLCDSQDIAGVAPVLRQASSVWLLGVQRELNELKRMLAMIPADIAKPTPADVTALGVGEFFVCWGRHAVKTYVQPAWMEATLAREVALGLSVTTAAGLTRAHADHARGKEQRVTKEQADALLADNTRQKAEIAALQQQLQRLQADHDLLRGKRDIEHAITNLQRPRSSRPLDAVGTTGGKVTIGDDTVPMTLTGPEAEPPMTAAYRLTRTAEAVTPFTAKDDEAFYQRVKARLIAEVPQVLRVLATAPELTVVVEQAVIDIDGASVGGRLAQLIAAGWFDEPQTGGFVQKELASQGLNTSPGTLYPALDKLTAQGFLRVTDGKDDRGRARKVYQAVATMKASIRRKAS